MIVVFIALILTIANSSNFLAGLWRTNQGEVYLGTTHYWEDYFFYVSQFFQGAHGGWLTLNRYTSETTPASILFWPNVILGKVGGLVGLPPQISYNVSIMLLSFGVLIILSRLSLIAFLLAALSTSLINRIWVNGQPMWYPFQLWKTPNFALDRLGGVPHQLVQTLLFLLLVYVWFFVQKKRVLFSMILMTLLTTLNPVMSGLFLVATWVTGQGNFFVTTVFLIVSLYYNTLTNAQPHIQSKLWEASQQTTTTPLFMLLSIGPVSLLGLVGAWAAIKRGARPIEWFSGALIAASYSLYFSPIPKLVGIGNSRVLFPALYAAWGILGASAMPSSKKMTTILLVLFLLLTIPTLKWELGQKLAVKPEERIPLLYLPSDIYKAFVSLQTIGTFDDIVLANPGSHMDAMVPALTGHTGYTGHPFATIGSEEKQAEVSRFFRGEMTVGEAEGWLRDRQIRYILTTTFDGDSSRLHQAYPFLNVLFTTGNATIWN